MASKRPANTNKDDVEQEMADDKYQVPPDDAVPCKLSIGKIYGDNEDEEDDVQAFLSSPLYYHRINRLMMRIDHFILQSCFHQIQF